VRKNHGVARADAGSCWNADGCLGPIVLNGGGPNTIETDTTLANFDANGCNFDH